MAFLERVSASNAGQAPATPRKPEVLGAPPTARQAADKVNPPAAAGRPIGRPPLPPPSFGAGAGRALPVTGQAAPAAPPTPGASRPAPPPRAPGQAGVGTAAPEQRAALGLVQSFDRVPTPAELAEVPEGVEVQTPYGAVARDGKLTLSPDGEVKYKEAMVKRRKQYGPHPFAGDPNAPPAPARLGGRMFNPFSGQWVD